jgi:hypothetical protein
MRERIAEGEDRFLIKERFGAKSVKIDPAQLLLLFQEADEPSKGAEPVFAEATRRS